MADTANATEQGTSGDSVAPRPLRPRKGDSAKYVLVTLLGEFVLPAGGAAWTGTMVDGLQLLGFSERNARQALARVGDDHLIEPERRGRRTRWHLTDRGRNLLEAGTERIYGFGQQSETWDGRWLVVHCSVPETMRRQRHQLHTRLAFEGFGFLSPTLAVSPHCHLQEAAGRVIGDLGLTELAAVLTARTSELSPDATILERAWDMDTLAGDYRSFIETADRSDPGQTEERFTALVRLVNDWRRFPFVDPELPHELLPDDWIGHEARARFQRCHAQWSPEANTWFAELEAAHER